MFSTTLKNILGMIAWGLGILLVCMVTLSLVLSNYLACLSAFKLLKWESKPIWLDELVGKFFETYFPETSLAHLSAISLSFGVAILLFFVTNEAFRILESVKMRALHRRAGDEDQVVAFSFLIKQQCLLVGLMAACLLPLICFDVYLYLFRGASSVLLENPQDATNLLPWSVLKQQPSFALNVTTVGSVAFVSLTAGLCILLEGVGIKFRTYADRLLISVDGLFEPAKPAELELRGYNSALEPVYDPGTPLAYDKNGDPLETIEGDVNSLAPSVPESNGVRETANQQPEEPLQTQESLFVVPEMKARPSAVSGEIGRGTTEGHSAQQRNSAWQTQPQARPTPMEDLKDVIGSFNEDGSPERVSMQTAVRDSRYFVDLTGRIWNRKHWEQLHEDGSPSGDDLPPSTDAQAA